VQAMQAAYQVRFVILTTAEDGTYSVIGPFSNMDSAETARDIIEASISIDTQIIMLDKFVKRDYPSNS
jgi:hypothetical protein